MLGRSTSKYKEIIFCIADFGSSSSFETRMPENIDFIARNTNKFLELLRHIANVDLGNPRYKRGL